MDPAQASEWMFPVLLEETVTDSPKELPSETLLILLGTHPYHRSCANRPVTRFSSKYSETHIAVQGQKPSAGRIFSCLGEVNLCSIQNFN